MSAMQTSKETANNESNAVDLPFVGWFTREIFTDTWIIIITNKQTKPIKKMIQTQLILVWRRREKKMEPLRSND